MNSSFVFNEPRQVRSQETMDHILDAAAQILETKNFEELTIAMVVKKAGTSVGAFYGRFKDKETLLQALDERFFNEFEQAIKKFVDSPYWTEKSIYSIISGVCALLVETYSQQRGVLRSLNLKGRMSNDPRFRKREQRAWQELFPWLQEILLSNKTEITHPDPSLATRLGFQQMFYGMREILLWEPLRDEVLYDPEILISEMTRAYLAYLGVQETIS
ncbi:MAG: TetR/AcrR family transcriptional regulator [Spirochaetales bacterium]|nr:TetR/AcrR family transcriptional regulator [Spirochaetales bacterium]